MRKYLLLIATALVALTGCVETEVGAAYIEVDGVEYALNEGSVYSYTSGSLGRFDVQLADDLTDSENYISFVISSLSTSKIESGVYEYNYFPSANEFDYIEVKTAGGDYLTENNSTPTGTITVSMNDDNYMFEFDMTFEQDGETYTLNGEFNRVLTAE